ncbi:MAG: metallophosphoesterase family protein [Runella slithyformis]|nr:MAG: metallophosphoesterase family protein [Runella slithyformis]TAE93988.1 MAG: metallophosphoesterase family protein [Runella slithyformis]TAF29963.1 MAG: metallophosphoesterase family protein [Runella slithyformis]TAF49079.1 MAG: metallophosphoesterase family protein [Runella slithyformis]TAF83574.1 MAG: metallophosphoesterase family protein [Runella slithyformis]
MKKKLVIFFALLLLATHFAMAQQLKRGPYLQIATPTSMVIRWRTDLPTDTKVRVGPTENQLTQEINVAGQRTDHEVTIANLQPSTVYFYAIGNSAATLQAGKDNYFKTAPPVGSTQKIRLWAMGDMGNNSQNQRDVADQYLKKINNDNRQTDGVILLGDNAYGIGTDEEFQNNFFNVYQDKFLKNNVVWPSAGNHEYYSGDQRKREIAYFQIFNMPANGQSGGVPSGTNMYYSYDCANVHVVSLDSYGIEENKFRMSDTLGPQIQWLKRDLAANKLPWTIVFFHHPPFTKNSHDSDLEGELGLIRRHVTPILERYKVDLVLSGHSHIYERSALMQGHTGFSSTFNQAQHVVNRSTARYDGSPNSCAYVNKNQGTIYAVVGSSGQIAGRTGPLHPAMVYSNVSVGGSLMIEVENNRLDAKWIAADGNVNDQFTIFKGVNKTNKTTARHGEKINLNASWIGSYVWSDGIKNQSKIAPQILGDTIFTVKDEQGCLLDQFEIKLNAKPRISVGSVPNTVCQNAKIPVIFSVTNTTADQWNYTVQLSNASGSFDNPVNLGSSRGLATEVVVPANTPIGGGYRLRVVANTTGIVYEPSGSFVVKQPAAATLSGERTINVGESTDLKIEFWGSAPWTYQIGTENLNETTTNPLIISVKPNLSTSYSLTKVANACGSGLPTGSPKVTVVPRLSTGRLAKTTLCAGSSISLPFLVEGGFEKTVAYTAQLSDKNGDFATPVAVGNGATSPIVVVLPSSIASGKGYRLRVIVDATATTLTGLDTLNIRPLATANMAGSATINFGQETPLTLTFTGDAPWNYALSDGKMGVATASPLVINVKPIQTTNYTFSTVSNDCGVAATGGGALVNVLILSNSSAFDEWVRVSPNPTANAVHFEMRLPQIQTISWQLLNVKGAILRRQETPIKTNEYEANFDLSTYPVGTYLLRVQVGEKFFTKKIIKK